jgi:hypothetical protein
LVWALTWSRASHAASIVEASSAVDMAELLGMALMRVGRFWRVAAPSVNCRARCGEGDGARLDAKIARERTRAHYERTRIRLLMDS